MLYNSDFVISLPESEYTSTFATLQQYETNPLQIPVNMFANAEQQVTDNALDLYFRFFNSARFQHFLSQKENAMKESQTMEEQLS